MVMRGRRTCHDTVTPSFVLFFEPNITNKLSRSTYYKVELVLLVNIFRENLNSILRSASRITSIRIILYEYRVETRPTQILIRNYKVDGKN